jgi:hypothetical protein
MSRLFQIDEEDAKAIAHALDCISELDEHQSRPAKLALARAVLGNDQKIVGTIENPSKAVLELAGY